MGKLYRSSMIVSIIALVILVACGPNQIERSATATAYIATSDALKQSYFQTQTAAPTRTPMPAYVPGPTKSSFENCAQSKYGIKYIISGTGVSAVSLTFENDTGGSDQGDYRVPFCKIFNNFQSGNFLYISAQIISGDGSIKCQILDGNTLIAEANASGFPSIATCSGSAK